MAKNNNLKDFLTGVAEAIRTKKGTTDLINPQDFESEISGISTEKPEQEKTVNLNMAEGNQVIEPEVGNVLSKVTVNKPDTLIPNNIKEGVSIGGVEGTFVGEKPEQEKSITVTENGTQEVTPDEGKVLSKVTVVTEIETGGGYQPTLFAPVITSGVNTVSWENNSSNGGFPVVISADIDGESVESPLTFTEDMDGKTLNVTANSDGFQEGISNVDLIYKHAGYSYAYISGYSQCSGRMSFSLESNSNIFSVNGVSSRSCTIFVNPRETINVSAEAYCSPDTDTTISLYRSIGEWYSFESHFGTGSGAFASITVNSKYTAKLVVYNNTTSSVWKNYTDRGYVSGGSGTSYTFTLKAGNVYTFIWDITITAY